MTQNRLYRLPGSIGQSHLNGLACVLVGVSQLPLAFLVGEQSLVLFIMGCAGLMLASIGVNLLRGKEPFDIHWSENERIAWLSTALNFFWALLVVAATGVILL